MNKYFGGLYPIFTAIHCTIVEIYNALQDNKISMKAILQPACEFWSRSYVKYSFI